MRLTLRDRVLLNRAADVATVASVYLHEGTVFPPLNGREVSPSNISIILNSMRNMSGEQVNQYVGELVRSIISQENFGYSSNELIALILIAMDYDVIGVDMDAELMSLVTLIRQYMGVILLEQCEEVVLIIQKFEEFYPDDARYAQIQNIIGCALEVKVAES